MNKYTWNVAPRGETFLKIITLAERRDVAKEAAIEIAHDIWQEIYAKNPDLQTSSILLSVEQVDTPINCEPVFVNG